MSSLSNDGRGFTRGGILLAAALVGAGLRALGGCDIGVAGTDDGVAEVDAGSTTYSEASGGAVDAAKQVVVQPLYDAGNATDTLVGPMVSPLCVGSALDAGVTCEPGATTCTPPAGVAPGAEGGAADAAEYGADAAVSPMDAGTGTAAPSMFSCHVTAVHAEAGAAVVSVCSAAGTGKDDAVCTGSSDCAPAFECVVDSSRAPYTGADGAAQAAVSGVCRRYCCDDVCPTDGSYCDIETTVTGSVSVPVCVANEASASAGDAGPACELLDDSTCGAGLTCQVVDKDSGQVACVTPGTATAGESCELDKCAKGLSCISGTFPDRKCAQLCDEQNDDCPSGQMCMPSAVLSSLDPQIGVCSPET